MVPAVRWLIVAAVALALVAAPSALRAIPARSSTISAVALAHQVRAAYDRGWSGEVDSQGNLQRADQRPRPSAASPACSVRRRTCACGGAAATTGASTGCAATGESDLAVDGGLEVTWTYESRKVQVLPYSSVRLPDDSDVVPVSLAHRMLSGAKASELSRLPSKRIAGRSAAGLQAGARRPSVDHRPRRHLGRREHRRTAARRRVRRPQPRTRCSRTQLVSFDPGRPSASDTHMHLDPGLSFTRGEAVDEAAGANVFAPFVQPAEVAGLPRLGDPTFYGAVGVYGHGPTALLAIPLRDFVAGQLRDQLRKSSTATEDRHRGRPSRWGRSRSC